MGRVRHRVRVRAILGSALFSWIFCVPKSHLWVGILNSRLWRLLQWRSGGSGAARGGGGGGGGGGRGTRVTAWAAPKKIRVHLSSHCCNILGSRGSVPDPTGAFFAPRSPLIISLPLFPPPPPPLTPCLRPFPQTCRVVAGTRRNLMQIIVLPHKVVY